MGQPDGAAPRLRKKLLILRTAWAVGVTSALMCSCRLSGSTVLQFSRCGTLVIEIGVQTTDEMSTCCLVGAA